MSDPHVSVTLHFRTEAPATAVLENVVTALNRHGMPYELAGVAIDVFDLDDAASEV